MASSLGAPAERLWAHTVDPRRLNREFLPWLRMTFPTGTRDLTAGWRPGVRVARSWILLGGLLPVEYDDLVFMEVEPGRRFLERSSMLTQRLWEHERTLEPLPEGCRLTDQLRFVPRLALLRPLAGPIFRAVFAWRHRRLRQLFGELPG